MSAQTITLSWPEPDIALLTFDMPGKGANVLSESVLFELSDRLDELEKRDDIAGVIFISGKPGQFIAGADLREFASSIDIGPEKTAEMCQKGQNLFKRLSRGNWVSVAAIEGICVGGGAELASWCDRRIMSDHKKTEFGFPEVKLGLFPGWGGTVRAPRIVGLSNAVEMITGGASISAAESYAMGWASDVVPSDDLLAAAMNLVRVERGSGNYLKDREIWNGKIDISEQELGFLGATASALIQQHSKGHYPAPVAALEQMMSGSMTDSDAACVTEATGMSQLFGSPINKSLLNIFFLTDRNKKDTGVSSTSLTPADIKSCGVIGAGIMGAGIAAANVKRKISATITDTREEALAKGVQGVLNEVSFDRATKKKDLDRAIEFAPLVNGTTSSAELAGCDLVIEAVIENLEIKQQVYANLESLMRDDAILASNTSTIPITQLASGLKRPNRFCGIHFFNPVRKMKLVEVIRGAETSDQTVATAVAYAKRIGKMPIVVNDGPGFLVNRLLLPYMNEALELIHEGAEIKDIEKAAKKFGMPMGPIELYDMVGLDTAVYAGKVLVDAFPDRFSGNPILPELVKAGRLGQKSGSGFYSYNNRKKKKQPDPELAGFLAPHVKEPRASFKSKELADRLFLPLINEASRILEEKLVRDARDIDLGMIFGTGFPPFKGGPMFWADSVGLDAIAEKMKPYESLGKRYQPTDLISDLAKNGGKFYGETAVPAA
jgi:3-hydroxyacyl-CoA dehydrogenase/enoyl-CoA hydratase/3-hydroxybutyryl-CoA epimerase/3-hydroxyacyl-CoA dehydrogenase/enoyl-CoA hydratase/3-hydroxybutyryl-CoA epimerase/enoyl-CoA isomerase